MNKSELISKFLEKGHLLSPSILDQITEEKLNSIQPDKNSLVLSSFGSDEIAFSVKACNQLKSATVKDIAEYHTKKYNTIKDILASKLNPISINKLPQSKGPTTIIGLVSGKGSFVIEDTTGKTEARFSGDTKQLKENSILGFYGEFKGKEFLISSVYYPDIPLTKQIKKLDISIKFEKENEAHKIIVNSEKEIPIRSTPAIVSIKKSAKINILVFQPTEPMDKNQATETLKLRFLPEPKLPTEDYIISEEPDIFWIIQKDSWTENYKGVAIISGENTSI